MVAGRTLVGIRHRGLMRDLRNGLGVLVTMLVMRRRWLLLEVLLLLLLLMRRGTQVGCNEARLTDLLVGSGRGRSLGGVLEMLRLIQAGRARLMLRLRLRLALIVLMVGERCLNLALLCLRLVVLLQMGTGTHTGSCCCGCLDVGLLLCVEWGPWRRWLLQLLVSLSLLLMRPCCVISTSVLTLAALMILVRRRFDFARYLADCSDLRLLRLQGPEVSFAVGVGVMVFVNLTHVVQWRSLQAV